MELTRDVSKRDMDRLKSYDRYLYLKWIPATFVDEKGLVNICENLEYGIPNSGRWAIYYKDRDSKEETLKFVLETENHNYRTMCDKDMDKLHSLDLIVLGKSYNVFDEVCKRNEEKKKKEEAAYREYNMEKAKDMYGYITKTQRIQSGIEFNKKGEVLV